MGAEGDIIKEVQQFFFYVLCTQYDDAITTVCTDTS
jgi:hypothetical protein